MSSANTSQSATQAPRTLSTGVVEMTRPMKYTSDTRQLEYLTLKQFRKSFTRAEYDSAIKQLNRRQKISNTAQEKARQRERLLIQQEREQARIAKEQEKQRKTLAKVVKFKVNTEVTYKKYGITAYEFGPFLPSLNGEDDINAIRSIVQTAIKEFRKTHPTGGEFQTTLVSDPVVGGKGVFFMKKNFDAFKSENIETFIAKVTDWASVYSNSTEKAGGNEEEADSYAFYITKLILKAIRPLAGGCRNRQKNMKINGAEVIDHQSRGKNNCFFTCCAEEFGYKYSEISRFSEKFFNGIRAKYGIPDDALISMDKAHEIYQKEFKKTLCVLNERSICVYGALDADKKLMLVNDHYMEYIGSIEVVKTCEKCYTDYVDKHDPRACAMRQTYRAKVMGKQDTRFVKMKSHKADSNTYQQVLHYDIETHTKNKHKRHTPYIVGYCYYDVAGVLQYNTITGNTCMEEFYTFLGSDAVSHIKYINAYKGSIFDNYYLVGVAWKDQNVTVNESLLMNNGRILKGEIQGKTLIDLGNHLTGTLRANLQSVGCAIQKGDIDHNTTNAWDKMPEELKADVKLYLEKDVLGLCELYNKINEDMYTDEQVNICDFLTTSHSAYTLWAENYLDQPVYIPTPKDDEFIRQSVYGGRCYKNKNRFISKQYEAVKNGTLTDVEEVDDYMVYLDVVSLYPTSMLREYPVGSPVDTSEYQPGKLGIYKIHYKPNKSLLTPVLPRRVNNALKWDLEDGTGVYTSVDIENAKRFGYEIEVEYGKYWEEKAPIFQAYINKFYQKKQNSVKDTAPYTTAKLYLNGLYGKMIQRPIYTKTFYPKDHSELLEIMCSHIITEMEPVGDRLVVIATPREEKDVERCVSKPTQNGAFILSYSREIMMTHIHNTNPDNKMDDLFSYTDTDSLMTHVNSMKNIQTGKNLGDLDNDLGTGKKVVRAIWISPKLYMLEYCYYDEKQGKIVMKAKYRGKGLNANKLSNEVYETMDAGKSVVNVADYQMKRVNVKRNTKEQHKDIFSVYHINAEDQNEQGQLKLQKVVNTVAWSGRKFIDDNHSLPWGHKDL